MTNRAFVEFLSVRPATRVLEVGSGLGLLAADVASTTAGVHVVGLEQSTGIELSVQPEVHWHGSIGCASWVQNLIGNVESARRGLIDSGLCNQAQVDDSIAELSSLAQNDDASSYFVWNRAMADR